MIQWVDWDSALWEELRGAYGGRETIADLKVILGEERAEDEEAIKALSYYYGIFTCPECGHRGIVIDLEKYYFTEG